MPRKREGSAGEEETDQEQMEMLASSRLPNLDVKRLRTNAMHGVYTIGD